MADIVLYHVLPSTCSQKVRFALAAKAIEYQSHVLNMAESENLEDWYLAINPNGLVPAIRHQGTPIHDSSVICEYLDEVFPQASMTPANAKARAEMRAWMRYFEEVPTAAIRVPSFNKLFIKSVAARGEAANRALRERMPLRKHFYERLGATGFDERTVAEANDNLRAALERTEKAVSREGPFLLGQMLTIADLALLPSVVRMEDLGMMDFWTDLPAVNRWYSAMQAHPAFAAAYEPGARLKIA